MQYVAVAVLAALLLVSMLSIETASALLIGSKDWVVGAFDWLFVGVTALCLVVVGVLGVVPAANVRLGAEGERPEFSRFSWFAMLFSAGLASGLLYWAVAEPILHHQGNPFLDNAGVAPGTEAAVASALRVTIFHWGLHGWGLYVVCGLAIALQSYRHDRPLTIRSALYPLLGARWIDRWPGRGVDLLSLLGTIFGVATSIGLAAAALNATLFALFGLPVDLATQIAIVFFVCGFGVISAASGVARGIRRLSEVNVWGSGVLLLTILALGPTSVLLSQFVYSGGDYLLTLVPMSVWTGETASEREWQGAWTVFYWGWWLAWMPFVSLFIARISRGRTLREFLWGVMAVPTLVVVLWMVVFGGTALHQELASPGSVSVAVGQDYSLGIVTLIANLGYPALAVALTSVAAFLLFTWLVTSLDSATLVICHLVETPDVAAKQVFWGMTVAVVTCALILVGGVPALQAASILIGLPLAAVTLAIVAGLVRSFVARTL
jgi:choline/glycine/proline betaine transport protein